MKLLASTIRNPLFIRHSIVQARSPAFAGRLLVDSIVTNMIETFWTARNQFGEAEVRKTRHGVFAHGSSLEPVRLVVTWK